MMGESWGWDSFWMVVFGEGFTAEVAFRLNPEGREGGRIAKSLNSIPGRGNSKHGGPEVEE